MVECEFVQCSAFYSCHALHTFVQCLAGPMPREFSCKVICSHFSCHFWFVMSSPLSSLLSKTMLGSILSSKSCISSGFQFGAWSTFFLSVPDFVPFFDFFLGGDFSPSLWDDCESCVPPDAGTPNTGDSADESLCPCCTAESVKEIKFMVVCQIVCTL